MKSQLNLPTKIFALALFISLSLFMACSESDGGEETREVVRIVVNVNKTTILTNRDSVIVSAQALDDVGSIIPGIEFDFFANDIPLDENVFVAIFPGPYRMSATYRDIVSENVKTITAISLEDNITGLSVKHNSTAFLTTAPWSASKAITFDVTLKDLNFEVETNEIELFLDGELTEQRDAFQWSEPGTHSFVAKFGEIESEPYVLEVREALTFETVEVPIVFHQYGSEISAELARDLLDTLNGAFNPDRYELQEVMDGLVNPNAINTGIRFVLATETPEGAALNVVGVNPVSVPATGDFLDQSNFPTLVNNNNWNTDEYINIWVLGNFAPTDDIPFFTDFGRGTSQRPVIVGAEVEGLALGDADNGDQSACFVVNFGSVCCEHPDYVVSLMGHFLGLFQTSKFDCNLEGDYMGDTPTMNGVAPDPKEFFSCEDYTYIPTNFMAIGRQYRDFTQDQAIRMRQVLRYGVGRPNAGL